MASKPQTQGNTGRPPTTSVLRSAIYYQNRIIVPEKKSRNAGHISAPDAKSTSPSNSSLPSHGSIDRPITAQRGPQTTSVTGPETHSNTKTTAHSRPTSLGPISDSATSTRTSSGNARASSATVGAGNTVASTRNYVSGVNAGCDDMESHGIDIVVTDAEEEEEKSASCFKRFYKCLQDNRMKGKPNAEEILASSNPEDFKVLKKVLNITFLTVGIALLISVVISIIYSKIGEYHKITLVLQHMSITSTCFIHFCTI